MILGQKAIVITTGDDGNSMTIWRGTIASSGNSGHSVLTEPVAMEQISDLNRSETLELIGLTVLPALVDLSKVPVVLKHVEDGTRTFGQVMVAKMTAEAKDRQLSLDERYLEFFYKSNEAIKSKNMKLFLESEKLLEELVALGHEHSIKMHERWLRIRDETISNISRDSE